MVVIDATTLMLLLQPDARKPSGPNGVEIDRPVERIQFLVERLGKARTKIIIPTPALSEVLVRLDAGEAQSLVEKINGMAVFRVESFDERAAIEVAIMTRNSVDGGIKPKQRDMNSTWAKLKYDRQIVAIALVTGATTIYSDDKGVAAIARRAKLKVIGLGDLELPPEDAQARLPFDERPKPEIESADDNPG
ncbi:MAG: hypothetical protein Q8O63_03120 [Hoeflea sp.]|nr:hypothetical protein [Hoeflea sp.]